MFDIQAVDRQPRLIRRVVVAKELNLIGDDTIDSDRDTAKFMTAEVQCVQLSRDVVGCGAFGKYVDDCHDHNQ